MSRSVQTHYAFLNLLCSTDTKQRKALLNTITTGQLLALCEVFLNLYKGSVHVTPKFVSKLRPYKAFIRTLTSRRVSKKRKKIQLIRRSPSLPWMLKPVLLTLKERCPAK